VFVSAQLAELIVPYIQLSVSVCSSYDLDHKG